MKVWGYVALAVALIAAIGGAFRWAYASGYDKRDLEVVQDIIDAQEATKLEEAEKWQIVVDAAEGSVIVEEKIVEKIRVVEKRIPFEVVKIVTLTPECADLGDGYAGLRNDQIRAANSVRDSEAGLPTD